MKRLILLALAVTILTALPVSIVWPQSDTLIKAEVQSSYSYMRFAKPVNLNILINAGFVEISDGLFFGWSEHIETMIDTLFWTDTVCIDSACDTFNVRLHSRIDTLGTFVTGYDLILISDLQSWGDVSGDGRMNILDVTELVTVLFNGTNPFVDWNTRR